MTIALDELAARAERLRGRHRGSMLVLPNAWDAASARAVEQAGFPAVATTSAGVAEVLGLADGEAAAWQDMFAAAHRIADAVSLPVTVDAEAGYGLEPAELVHQLVAVGAAGCNLEDTDHRAGGLRSADAQAEYLSGVRAAAHEAGVPLVINARVDAFLPSSGTPEAGRLAAAIARGRVYRDAGADCIYPVGVRSRADLAEIVSALDHPVNGNVTDELPLSELRRMGVARVSFGPGFYRAALTRFGASLEALHEEAGYAPS